jgi:hypothetical protein
MDRHVERAIGRRHSSRFPGCAIGPAACIGLTAGPERRHCIHLGHSIGITEVELHYPDVGSSRIPVRCRADPGAIVERAVFFSIVSPGATPRIAGRIFTGIWHSIYTGYLVIESNLV